MSDPRIQPNGNVDYMNLYQGEGVRRVPEEEEEIFQFSDDDKKFTREVDNQPREIRVGHDKDGKKFRYTDDTHEVLIPKTTEGKNTYLTKAEFDRQVMEILHVKRMPDGIKAEFRDGSIVFVDQETNLTMTGAQLREDARVLAAQQEPIQPIDPKQLLQGYQMSISQNLPDPPAPTPITVPDQITEADRNRLLAAIKENPNDYLPLLSELYGNTKQGQMALQRLVRDNFDTSKPSGASAEDINRRLAEVKSPLRGMGQLFLDAEERYGVNAWAILSVVGIESSYGKNRSQGTRGNFVGMKRRGSNQHRELAGATREQTYRNNINAVAHQIHLYNTRDHLKSPYEVATRYCNVNKGPWSNFMATEIVRGQGIRGQKPSEELLAQLRGEPVRPQPVPTPQPIPASEEVASVQPFNEPAIEEIEGQYTNMIDEVTITGSLSKVKKKQPENET